MCGGGGGGDGGAAERKAAEGARVAAAVKKINNVMGNANATPDAVDRADFTRKVETEESRESRRSGADWTPRYQEVFDNDAYNAAVANAKQEAEASRAAYGERAKLYDTIKTDANQHALIDLNKERDITERNLSFDVARQGLSGGSHDIDTMRQVTDTYQQGVLKAAELASSIANNARAADDKTRTGLISSISAGLDQGSAQSQAYSDMRNNADRATADANSLSLAGFFDRLNNLNQQRKYNNGVAVGSAVPGTTTPGTTQPKSFTGSGGSY